MWNVALEVIALFGGLSAIAAAVAAFVSKALSDRWLEGHKSELQKEVEKLKSELGKEQETHKLLLKRKEILFSREIDAAKAFFELHQRVSPTYSFPDKEWSDVVEEVIEDFGKIEKELGNFVRDHGPFLAQDIRTLVDKTEELSSSFKFHASGHGSGTRKQAEDAAETVLQSLREIEQRFTTLLQT